MTSLDPTKAKWPQISAALERDIHAGVLAPDAQVPGAVALSAQWGVSLTVARKALADLREKGLIRAENGVGTFVNGPSSDA
ncbi:winged helix-turn-helix domain-containing protein [Streptomyces sp. NPDC001982]|uniref:winged helix-turn-helix domain-containing protein n=1 Tax=Streptomyces sp. NPDC001982 TaxID=3154405 RepID=UPI003331219B